MSDQAPAVTGGAADLLPGVGDLTVDPPERRLLARLPAERHGQLLLRAPLPLSADVMHPLEPEPERPFRHAPVIARDAPVFSAIAGAARHTRRSCEVSRP